MIYAAGYCAISQARRRFLFFAGESCIVASHDISNLLTLNTLAKVVVLALIVGLAILHWSGLHQHVGDADVASIHGGHIHAGLHQGKAESNQGSSIGADLSVLGLLFMVAQLLLVALSAVVINFLYPQKQQLSFEFLSSLLVPTRHRWRPPLRAPPAPIL